MARTRSINIWSTLEGVIFIVDIIERFGRPGLDKVKVKAKEKQIMVHRL
jgi:hypothetical protein